MLKLSFFLFILGFFLTLITVFFSPSIFRDTGEGVQKFHQRAIPRVGGLAIYLSIFLILFFYASFLSQEVWFFLGASFPLFLAGLLEDITQRISPLLRLLAAFFSAALAFFWLKARLTSVDIFFLDPVLARPWVSFIFTCFAIAGVSQAFNIIDGLHGLSSGVAMLVLGAYLFLSKTLQDLLVFKLSLLILVPTLAFFLWNFPWGRITLGDSGAYFLGYAVATLGVLLVARNPEVSPWFPLLTVIYPVWETVFSIYRRGIKGRSPTSPDVFHLHSLLYRRVLNRHAYCSLFLWSIELVIVIWGLAFWSNTLWLALGVLVFILFYTWLYARIVRFRLPKVFKVD